MTLDEIASRAFPESDERAARCRAALDKALAEERKALREIVGADYSTQPSRGAHRRLLAALDARSKP